MALSDDFSRGLIQKSTYIRVAITTPRHDMGDNYNVALPLPGVTLTEIFSEAALLVRDELVEVVIAPFTITWTQPELLPSFTPTAVQSMPIGGRGYLYFALGADNQAKTKTQQVDPTRLYTFYKMSRSDFLAELSRLLDAKTAAVDISALSIRWLNKSAPAAREFGSIADVVTQLRKEMSEAIAKIPVPTLGDEVNHTHSLSQIEQLTLELNSKTSEDEFNGALAKRDEVLAQLTNWIAELRERIALIEAGTPQSLTSIIRLNCAGADYTDSTGKTWQAEAYSVGGGGTARPIIVEDTLDQDLFATIRWGLEGYDIPVNSAGNYTVRLYFFEPENRYRKFDISLQGQVQQADFSIYDEAGDFGKILVKNFVASATDIISIRFHPTVADAIISAIEVLQ